VFTAYSYFVTLVVNMLFLLTPCIQLYTRNDMKTKTKSLLVYKFMHYSNRDLAKLLYGEVNSQTLARVWALKSISKKQLLKIKESSMKAYIPLNFSNSLHLSYKDLKHYGTTTAFYHDSVNDLNLRYLADVARYVNSKTMRDAHFEALLFQYLQYYVNLFERNKRGNVKLYYDTKRNALRGHHKNKALLYYIVVLVYCKHYRCPNSDTRELIKSIIFTDNEDANDIISYYRSHFTDVLFREVFL